MLPSTWAPKRVTKPLSVVKPDVDGERWLGHDAGSSSASPVLFWLTLRSPGDLVLVPGAERRRGGCRLCLPAWHPSGGNIGAGAVGLDLGYPLGCCSAVTCLVNDLRGGFAQVRGPAGMFLEDWKCGFPNLRS